MDEIKLAQAHRQLMLSSMKHYVKEMFRQQYNKEFVFNTHHQQICDALDKVVRGETKKLIINIAPRYSKTELCVKMFISYGLAVNPKSRFIHLSYSQNLATDNSVAAKDLVGNEYYEMIFGHRLRAGRNSKTKWDTNEGGGVYATSTLGQITGFGAGAVEDSLTELEEVMLDKYCANDTNKFSGAIIIDDPIKPEDALSDNAREAVNKRFESTIRNRVNSRNTPIIIIMQRLHENDLCGYLMEKEPGEWTVLSLPCLEIDEQGNEKALWPFKHTLEELHHLREIDPYVFESQYQQNPIVTENLMYQNIRTYETLPILEQGKFKRKNYTDTADTGSDWFCSICYIETQEACYITDLIYSKKSAEFTEPETARMLYNNETDLAMIESNNGGRIIARNIENNLRKLGDFHTTIKTFPQTKNKETRMLSNAAAVCNMIYFPSSWERKWPEFARDIKSFRRIGKNAHDDAPDCLTGIVENHQNRIRKNGVEVF